MNAMTEMFTPKAMRRTRLAEPTPAPNAKPIWSHSGRRSAIEKAIDLTDDLIAKFEKQAPSEVGVLEIRRQELRMEFVLTAEASIPSWFAERHASVLAARDNQIGANIASSRHVVEQFLDARQPGQAGRYALQQIDMVLRTDREFFQ